MTGDCRQFPLSGHARCSLYREIRSYAIGGTIVGCDWKLMS